MKEWLLIICVFSWGIFAYLLTIGYQKEEFGQYRIVGTYRELAGWVKHKGKGSLWYRGTGQMLRSMGASFHYGRWVQPISYLVLRLLSALLGVLAVCRIGIGYGVIAGTLLFCLPNWLLIYLNERDNRQMLPEIRLVYHALEIQLQAGVHITDALAECYGCVTHPRLHQALLDLAGDIVMKADLRKALEEFQGKFNNSYIDSLCIVLVQALESGQAVELLKGIAEQIKDMEKRLLDQKKAALERNLTFYQLGILASVLGIALYGTLSQLLGDSGLLGGMF